MILLIIFENEIKKNDLNMISNNAKEISYTNSIQKLSMLEYQDILNLSI